ncbi:CDP-glycerol glycerophosphotransferase family protein [Lactiplantibacillus fabifermentans]|uniref:Ribitolphosphotransferase n=2 Tax=Lactiplantibacillus fabifermentans TaxID=483011 RepID=A0A0R2NXA3_9LACO|nr:CDP-glycerol glycerophosphotransferase family protein [Lactiplantibacillus fabifermentans]ETY74377.1 ribitolphosphotransferase [Lactiplantibacillus fabifermentans T30PCM01]KRO28259.1 ribitolphosphotransferase [Lactiplantibacillus fabifermentans DSM 21115]
MLQRIKRVARRIVYGRQQPTHTVTPVAGVTPDDENMSSLKYLNEPRLDNEAESLIKRQVKSLEFNSSYLTIEGQAYFEKYPEADSERIIKSLILVGDQGEEFEVPLVNTAIKNEKFPEAGYRGAVNFSTLSAGKPLIPGTYQVKLQLKQYLEKGWLIRRTTVGKIMDADQDLNYTTKMTSYSAKSNKSYSLIFRYSLAAQDLKVTSYKLSEINPLENEFSDDTGLDTAAMRALKRRALKVWYHWYCLSPIKKKQISFVSDSRVTISGNFEFIYQELKRRHTDFKISFYLKPSIKTKKTWKEVRTLAKALATSRYVILDDFYPLVYPLHIRENADLIQVWHAVGAFKTFGYSRLGMPGGPKITSLNHRNYTRALVSSHNIADKYAEGFGIAADKVEPLGIPRTDIFFDEPKKKEIRERLEEELPFIKGKKVILFAPTFRGNGQQSAYYPFEMLNFKEIYEALHEDYVFLLKIHPFVQNKPTLPYEYSDFYYDVSDYREINDLLLVADQLITDYSSVCFEYALLKRPMIFFAPDLADYMQSRSFYFNYFDFIPGSLAENTTDLISQMEHPQLDQAKLDGFVNFFFDDLDGKATSRFVDALENNFEDPDAEELEDTDGPELSEDGKIIPSWGKKTPQA